MSSKAAILARLRAAQTPFTDIPPVSGRLHMTPLDDVSPAALRARFITEAAKISVRVHPCADDAAAVAQIGVLVGADTAVMAWDWRYLPAGLEAFFASRGVAVSADLRDTAIRVGITGVDAALATTGSLAVSSGEGKPRAASLLPAIHVAVVRESQLIPDLEAFFESQRAVGLDAFRARANTVIITGGSRTADIAQELIQGAHGPIEVHVILIAE